MERREHDANRNPYRSLSTANPSHEMTIKDHVKGTASFQYYRDSALWYKTNDTGFLFPVPLQDIGTTTFEAEYKSIRLMRWIRMYIEDLNNA